MFGMSDHLVCLYYYKKNWDKDFTKVTDFTATGRYSVVFQGGGCIFDEDCHLPKVTDSTATGR